ncbi:MAG TPA: HlyD family type I secretion periplasmic adaptor subunit [Candidatus Avidesulfovibrio excrementigallinarum]|nr:HlyD family type I secretion periplasmic adaptor subunit [Candidatus Avidesulfovibrio excrementigallinarum]
MDDKVRVGDKKPDLPAQFNGVAVSGAEERAPLEPKAARSLFEPVALSSQLLPEDLPYAAEVEAALARRPTRRARWLSLCVCCFFIVFVIWAGFAVLDEVTHAEGQVVPSSRTQIIQNLEGGILSEVEVHEGQIVEKNDVLARLNNEMAESNLNDMLYKAMENLVAIRRLRATVSGKALVWPEDMRAWLELGTGYDLTDAQLEQGRMMSVVQEETFAVQQRQRESEIHVLMAQAEQRRQEVKEQLARKAQLTRSLSLIRQQLGMAASLLEKRSYSRAQYLELQERSVQVQGEINTLEVSIPRAEAAASEAEHRINLRKAEIDATIMEEIGKRSLELASLRAGLSAGSDRVTRTELRSPVRGTVKQIYINTVGGVVKPGEPIMEIVPLDDTLLVEARVRPADVAFLRPGQKAMVKISAYDFSIYGGLDGVLEQISADTIEDKHGEFYYQVKVRTPQSAIVYRGEELPIMPGMMATVDIMTGKKSVLDYLLKPILKAQQNALREK